MPDNTLREAAESTEKVAGVWSLVKDQLVPTIAQGDTGLEWLLAFVPVIDAAVNDMAGGEASTLDERLLEGARLLLMLRSDGTEAPAIEPADPDTAYLVLRRMIA